MRGTFICSLHGATEGVAYGAAEGVAYGAAEGVAYGTDIVLFSRLEVQEYGVRMFFSRPLSLTVDANLQWPFLRVYLESNLLPPPLLSLSPF